MRTIVKGKCVEETSRMRKGYRQEAIDADLSHWKYAGRYFIGADDRGRFSEPEINERSDYVYNYK